MLIVSDKEIPDSVLQKLELKKINSEYDICDEDTLYYMQTLTPKVYKKYTVVIMATDDEMKAVRLQRAGEINSYFLLNDSYIKNFKDCLTLVKTKNKINDSLVKMCNMVSKAKFAIGV